MTDSAGDDAQADAGRVKPGPRMSAARKVARDAAIMAALHAGDAVGDVARRYDLTPRHVRKIAREFELRPTGIERTPMEIIERVLRTYESQMRTAAAMVEENVQRMPAVAIAALREHAAALERYTELLGDVGKLPSNLAVFRMQAEVEQIGRRIVDLLDDAAEGRISLVEARERMDSELHVIEGSAFELPAGDEPSR